MREYTLDTMQWTAHMRLQCEGEEERRVNWKLLYRKFYFLHAPVLYDYTRERIRQWEQAMETQDDRCRAGGNERAGYMRAGEGVQLMMEYRGRSGEGGQVLMENRGRADKSARILNQNRGRAGQGAQVMIPNSGRVDESAQVMNHNRLTQQEKECAVTGR
jgi:hypothetical protein